VPARLPRWPKWIVASPDEITGTAPGQHHMRFRGTSDTPDLRNHADLALQMGLKWARLDSNAAAPPVEESRIHVEA
jgi:hypothetical protein